jgi:hypothetical protein
MPEQRFTATPRAWLAGVRQRFDSFLAGAPPSDPLYLSNRTWKQKLLLAALIGSPVVLVLLLVIAGSTDMLRFHKVNPYQHAAAPAATKAPEPHVVPAGEALEVTNLRIARDVQPPVVTGEVRNNTDHAVHSAEITYLLADNNGSVLATESTHVQDVGPHGVVTFQAPLKSSHADYVVVRDVRAN